MAWIWAKRKKKAKIKQQRKTSPSLDCVWHSKSITLLPLGRLFAPRIISNLRGVVCDLQLAFGGNEFELNGWALNISVSWLERCTRYVGGVLVLAYIQGGAQLQKALFKTIKLSQRKERDCTCEQFKQYSTAS